MEEVVMKKSRSAACKEGRPVWALANVDVIDSELRE
jgi:hypothetical protein